MFFVLFIRDFVLWLAFVLSRWQFIANLTSHGQIFNDDSYKFRAGKLTYEKTLHTLLPTMFVCMNENLNGIHSQVESALWVVVCFFVWFLNAYRMDECWTFHMKSDCIDENRRQLHLTVNRFKRIKKTFKAIDGELDECTHSSYHRWRHIQRDTIKVSLTNSPRKELCGMLKSKKHWTFDGKMSNWHFPHN